MDNALDKKETVLITGVAGLIGSQLAKYIHNLNPKVEIVGIDSLQGGWVQNVDTYVKFYVRDLAKDSVEDIFFKHRPLYVFHCAAFAAEGLSIFSREHTYKNNVLPTANIVNCCINFPVKRLVFTSSMAVYGERKDRDFQESDIPLPIDPYGIAKLACEMDIQSAGKSHDLDWCIIRPHNVYGPNQNIWDPYRNVLGIWMKKILSGENPEIYGDGEQVRAFTFISDILPCLWQAATSPRASREIINLGGTTKISINQAAAIFQKITGTEIPFEYKSPRFEVKVAVPTSEKSVDLLGFGTETPLECGIRQMWEWAQKNYCKRRLSIEPIEYPKYETKVGIHPSWYM